MKKKKNLWDVEDPLGRKIILTRAAYSHVKKRHPGESVLHLSVKEGIKNPYSIWRDIDKSLEVWYYFIEVEEEKLKLLHLGECYIVVVVKKKEGLYNIATWYKVTDASKKGGRKVWQRK